MYNFMRVLDDRVLATAGVPLCHAYPTGLLAHHVHRHGHLDGDVVSVSPRNYEGCYDCQ